MDAVYKWPTWGIVAVIAAATLIANIISYHIAKRRRDQESDRAYGVSSSLKGGILGLVALLIGFTYSLTSSRYDEREHIVLNEANAIGTCYLRAGLLKELPRERIRAALRRYTDARLSLFERGLHSAEAQRLTREMDAELDVIWSGVSISAEADPERTRTSAIVPAANDVIDLSATRAWASRNFLPPPVILLLGVCMVVSGAITGHSFGQVHRPAAGLWALQNVLMALVLFVILDFDRPRRGLITVDHQPLVDVRATIRQ